MASQPLATIREKVPGGLCKLCGGRAHPQERGGALLLPDLPDAVEDPVVDLVGALSHESRLHHVQRRGGDACDGAG